MPRGRPTSYTPERGHAIAIHLQYACPLEVAAQAEGVSVATVRQWLMRYPAFAAEVEQAQARCAVQLLGYLNRAAAQGNWRAAAWLLERIAPQRYGPPTRRIGLCVEEDDPDVSQMSDEELVALLARLSQEQQCPVPRLLSALDHPATRNGSNDYHHTTAATTTISTVPPGTMGSGRSCPRDVRRE
jgi:hypothetical protein